jgi:uncharacterized protein YkwD
VTFRARWALLVAIIAALLLAAILWIRAPGPRPAAPGPDAALPPASAPPPSAPPDSPAPPIPPVQPDPPPAAPPLPSDAPPTAPDDPRQDLERLVFELTNGLRAGRGRPPLAPDAVLDAAARAHSEDMLQRQFFGHVDPDGHGPADRVTRVSGLAAGAVGENIWLWSGSTRPTRQWLAEQAVAAWAASPAHRDNILRDAFTHLGVGAVYVDGDVRLTQLFRE